MAIKSTSESSKGTGTRKRSSRGSGRKKKATSKRDSPADGESSRVASPAAGQATPPGDSPTAGERPASKRTAARRARRKKAAKRAAADRDKAGGQAVEPDREAGPDSAAPRSSAAPADRQSAVVPEVPPAAAAKSGKAAGRASKPGRKKKAARPRRKKTPRVTRKDDRGPDDGAEPQEQPATTLAIAELVVTTEPAAASPTAAAETQAPTKPPKKKPAIRQRERKKPSRWAKDKAARSTAKKTTGDRKKEAAEPSKPEMIINVSGEAECRIAILENGHLEELYIERQSAESHVGSIYKGRVTNVEPSIQAVFIDFGHPRNGFLHISDVHPRYFPNGEDVSEKVGKKIPRRDRPPIQRCFRRGQEVVVQVTKEGVGTKGPTLTTYLSIPGRFLVLMPGMSRLGVSRKIEDQAERRTMREALGQLPLPEGMGFILRTAGLGRSKRDLQRDLNYLSRLWKNISERIRKLPVPAEVYQESDLVVRTIRDVSTSELARIVVDDEATGAKAREFLKIALPRTQNLVEVYDQPEPIFHKFGIEEEIERINSRQVPLPLGGSLVIEATEAMVAIDVNSGRFRNVDDAEESAFQLNLQAADEIARQLRLRDLGGLIVCDFIDMRLERHKREVERRLRNALKKHKERARILRMSQFGLIEMTRQRQRPSIKRSIYAECPHCRGAGMVKSSESMALEVMRVLQLAAHQSGVRKVFTTVSLEIANMLLNQKRARLYELETETGTAITIRGSARLGVDQLECTCEDERGRSVPAPV